MFGLLAELNKAKNYFSTRKELLNFHILMVVTKKVFLK